MKVTEAQARKLLAAAKKASQGMERARTERDAAVKACMEAGIPRADIMAATGLSRRRIYDFLSDTP